MSSYSVRDWVTIGLFGALWGVVETTLGTYLNLIFPSFTDTFIKGLVLGGIGVAVALTGRFFVPKLGSVFCIGVVTALLKTLSPAGARLGPILAILMQGIWMELAVSVPNQPRRWAFVAGGGLAVAWNLPHRFLMMALMYGRSVIQVYEMLAEDGAAMLGLDPSLALWILGILLGVRLIAGGMAGWAAWALGGAVSERRAR